MSPVNSGKRAASAPTERQRSKKCRTVAVSGSALIDVPVAGPDAEAQIARVAEKQLRLTMLAVPHWRSGQASREPESGTNLAARG